MFLCLSSVEKVTEGEEIQERIVKGWADRSVLRFTIANHGREQQQQSKKKKKNKTTQTSDHR